MSMNPGALVPVFDIGNVLIRWDVRALAEKLFDEAHETDHFMQNVWSPDWNLEQDKGRSWDEAVAVLSAEHPDYAEQIAALHTRWIETVPGSIDGTVKILKYLKNRGDKVYAITNFCAEKLKITQEHYDFLTLFDGMVVSGAERMIKPDAAIYRLFLDRYGLDAEQVFFTDDSPANVEGAREIGINAVLFTSPEQLQEDMKAHGLLDRACNLL